MSMIVTILSFRGTDLIRLPIESKTWMKIKLEAFSDCTFTVLSHIPILVQQLMDDFNVESIFGRLQIAEHSNIMGSKDSTSSINSLVNNNNNNEPTTSTIPTSAVSTDNNNNEPTPTSSIVLVDRPNDSDSETAKVTETTTHNQGEISGNNSGNTSQESGTNSPLRSPANATEEAERLSKQQKMELWTEVKVKSK